MNCSTSSSFVPSNLVTAFHGIPHVDIDLNPSPSDFQISLDYFEAIIIWACVPILVVVCLFVLLSVYFICVCCCCCFQQHDKRSTCSKATCGVLITLLVVLSLCMVGVSLWADFEWDGNLNQFVSTARDTDSLVRDIQLQAKSYAFANVTANLTVLDDQIPMTEPEARIALEILIGANQNLGRAFREISTKASLDSFSTVLDMVSFAELVRHWTVFAYLIVLVLVLILLAGSLCCSAACRSPACSVITLILFSFMTFTVWVAVGGNLAYLVVAGDICHDPDNLIRNYTSNVPNATISASVIDYYLVCDETCMVSPFQESYNEAIAALSNISNAENVVQDYIAMNMPTLLPQIVGVQMAFNKSASTIANLTMLSNCTRINSDYISLLDNFCTNGYLFSLVLFGMICCLAVAMLLLVICTTFFAGLLSLGKEYDEETIVYDFPGEQSSPWESYGGGENLARPRGHYTQFRGEEYNMRPSPPTDNPGPPKI